MELRDLEGVNLSASNSQRVGRPQDGVRAGSALHCFLLSSKEVQKQPPKPAGGWGARGTGSLPRSRALARICLTPRRRVSQGDETEAEKPRPGSPWPPLWSNPPSTKSASPDPHAGDLEGRRTLEAPAGWNPKEKNLKGEKNKFEQN